MTNSQEFEKMFPAKQPSRVIVTTNDGRQFEEYLELIRDQSKAPQQDSGIMASAPGTYTQNRKKRFCKYSFLFA